jgi:hypothetical protein
MKCIVFIWFLLGISICFAKGQRSAPANRRTTTISLRARSEVGNTSITFLTVPNGAPVLSLGSGEGILSLGRLSNVARSDERGTQIQAQNDSFVVSTRIGLRVDLSDSSPEGTATVSAYLLSPDPLRTMSMDGVQLSTTPGIIARQVFYGAITEHVLKITILASMAPGQLIDVIGVIATPN